MEPSPEWSREDRPIEAEAEAPHKVHAASSGFKPCFVESSGLHGDSFSNLAVLPRGKCRVVCLVLGHGSGNPQQKMGGFPFAVPLKPQKRVFSKKDTHIYTQMADVFLPDCMEGMV